MNGEADRVVEEEDLSRVLIEWQGGIDNMLTQILPLRGSPTVILAAEPVMGRSARPVIRRDLAFEWAIMERLNPEFAGRVKEQVDYYLAQNTPSPTR